MGKIFPENGWADSKINKIVIVASSWSFILFTYNEFLIRTFRQRRVIWRSIFPRTAGQIVFYTRLTLVRIPSVAPYLHLCLCCTVKVGRLYYWLISHPTKSIALQSTINKFQLIIWAKFQILLQQKYFLSCRVRKSASLTLYELSHLFQNLFTVMSYSTLRNTSALLTDAFSGAKKCQDRSSGLFFRTTSVKSTNILVRLYFCYAYRMNIWRSAGRTYCVYKNRHNPSNINDGILLYILLACRGSTVSWRVCSLPQI